MTKSEPKQKPVFDYRALRLLLGLVAFLLPVLAWLLSSESISSISVSYYTDARDVFVGSLFVIGALFFAYNGHTPRQKWVSKGASFAAIITAIYPTACETCASDIKSVIHYVAAVALFSTIAYFCLGPFRKNTKGKKDKSGRRDKIYLACGWIIIGCMLVAGIAEFTMSDAIRQALRFTFWAELVMLWTFAIAWIVAGKVLPPFVNEKDRLKLSLR